MAERCPFCVIAEHDPNAQIELVLGDSFVITPLNPVTDGHKLVIPMRHVADARRRPDTTASVMRDAARYIAGWMNEDCNLITSVGPAATQTVEHLHVHVVPRREGDGLLLPWSSVEAETTAPAREADTRCDTDAGGAAITREACKETEAADRVAQRLGSPAAACGVADNSCPVCGGSGRTETTP